VIAVDTKRWACCPVIACVWFNFVTLKVESLLFALRLGRTLNLKQLMEAADVLKVFHFARFDIATAVPSGYPGSAYVQKIASKLARTYTNQRFGARARAGGTRQERSEF